MTQKAGKQRRKINIFQMSIQNSESVTYHPAVIWSLGHLVKMISELSKSSTIYKYLIFIYSEQMTHSENENDHFDLDHFDHICFLFLIDFLGHIGIFIYFCAQNIETHSWR